MLCYSKLTVTSISDGVGLFAATMARLDLLYFGRYIGLGRRALNFFVQKPENLDLEKDDQECIEAGNRVLMKEFKNEEKLKV